MAIPAEPVGMTAAKRRVSGARLLIVAANLATIAAIVKLATVSPVGAVVLVAACVLVVLAQRRREVLGFIHRITAR
ncbi:MAG: hypothetical protein ACM3SX_06835 [Deltaproteobacteria bacterium]